MAYLPILWVEPANGRRYNIMLLFNVIHAVCTIF